jgi:hypothetical protein
MRAKAKRRKKVASGVGDRDLDLPAQAKPSPGMPTPTAPGKLSLLTASPRWWTAIACAILLVSAGIRQWRDLQFSGMAHESETCPFPLAEIPRSLGTWTSDERDDGKLDAEIANLAGSRDHIVRGYRNDATIEVSTLVLYGLATSVFAHTPDICYRAGGYQQVRAPENLEIPIAGSTKPVKCRAFLFSKKIGGGTEYYEVIDTFLHNGEWLPEVASRWKMFRYHPGMFKIQLERKVSELSFDTSPSRVLLAELVQTINKRVADAKARDQKAKADDQAAKARDKAAKAGDP